MITYCHFYDKPEHIKIKPLDLNEWAEFVSLLEPTQQRLQNNLIIFLN